MPSGPPEKFVNDRRERVPPGAARRDHHPVPGVTFPASTLPASTAPTVDQTLRSRCVSTDQAPSTASLPARVLASRLRWIVPAVLLVVWLVVAGGGGAYSGKLAQVQKNDASSYLPASAESSKVSELQKKFTTAQTFPAPKA